MATVCASTTLREATPHLFRVLAPVWLASPYEVAAIDDEIRFDTVILVDAGATTIAENLGAIRRAKQVVAFGDPVTQTPTLFETGIDDAEHPTERSTDHGVDALHADSALARLGELLPTLTLTRSYRAGGEDLAELVNRRFYGGRIVSLPWAGSFLGHGSLGLDYVQRQRAARRGHRRGRDHRRRGREGRRARAWSTPSSARASRSW